MQHAQLVIIGSGPAGYTAGLYASRAQLDPVLYAGIKTGGQLMYTTDVENYPGFPAGIEGPQLIQQMREQAQKFGTHIRDEFVTAVDVSQRPFRIWTGLPAGITHDVFQKSTPAEEIAAIVAQTKSEIAPTLTTDALIIATGAVSRMTGATGEEAFIGRGVSTCAVCDAAFFRDKTTFIVGGGDSAMEDALALTKFAESVTLLVRRDQLRASKIMQERVLSNQKVTVLWNTTLEEVKGTSMVEQIVVKTNGKAQELAADGVFIAIGHIPMTQLFKDQLTTDEHGYLITRASHTQLGIQAAQSAVNSDGLVAFPTMASQEGVFVAGDVVDVRYKQAVTAAASGCMAALDAERWLEKQEGVSHESK